MLIVSARRALLAPARGGWQASPLAAAAEPASERGARGALKRQVVRRLAATSPVARGKARTRWPRARGLGAQSDAARSPGAAPHIGRGAGLVGAGWRQRGR